MKFDYIEQALDHVPTIGFINAQPKEWGTYTCLVKWNEGCSLDDYDYEVLELVFNNMTKCWCDPETMLESLDFIVLGYKSSEDGTCSKKI